MKNKAVFSVPLTNDLVEKLLNELKHFTDLEESFMVPTFGQNQLYNLEFIGDDPDLIERFLRFESSYKGHNPTEQKLTIRLTDIKSSNLICRLDFARNIRKHREPDGSYVDCPHLHIYKDGSLEGNPVIELPMLKTAEKLLDVFEYFFRTFNINYNEFGVQERLL